MKRLANFIITKDAEVANKLISKGFRLINSNNNTYTFENSPMLHMDFDAKDNEKIIFTNMLSL